MVTPFSILTEQTQVLRKRGVLGIIFKNRRELEAYSAMHLLAEPEVPVHSVHFKYGDNLSKTYVNSS